MLRPATLALLAGVSLAGLSAPAATMSGSLSVLGTSNVFGAAGNAGGTPNPGGFGGGTVAPYIDLTALNGAVSLNLSTGGLLQCCVNAFDYEWNQPDGRSYVGVGNGTTNLNAVGYLSGIQFTNRQMFLAGVFVGNSMNPTPPPTLQYAPGGEAALYIAPLLQQVFFAGDGWTGDGTGVQQTFLIPFGATRLYLGFADAWGFTGDPGAYNDNNGTLNLSFTLNSAPEPGTTALLLLGLAGLALLGRRRG